MESKVRAQSRLIEKLKKEIANITKTKKSSSKSGNKENLNSPNKALNISHSESPGGPLKERNWMLLYFNILFYYLMSYSKDLIFWTLCSLKKADFVILFKVRQMHNKYLLFYKHFFVISCYDHVVSSVCEFQNFITLWTIWFGSCKVLPLTRLTMLKTYFCVVSCIR